MEQETKAGKKSIKELITLLCGEVHLWYRVEYLTIKYKIDKLSDDVRDWAYRTFTSKTKQRLDACHQWQIEEGYEPYDPEDWEYRSYRYLHPKRVYACRIDEKQGKITHELSVKPADFCTPASKDFRKAGIRRCLNEIDKDFSEISDEEFRDLNKHCNYIIETNRIVYEIQKIAAQAKIYLRQIFGKKILGISLQYDWEVQESSDSI